ncbi:MAG TPA: transposase [Candidatus Woesebacteria bacterium]|nr:transposase [Candidatus Woesebacteria bacterium]
MYYHRRSIRLKGYNYSQNWFYFVTICAKNRGNVFGEIVGARRDSPLINKNNIFANDLNSNLFEMKLNQNGEIIDEIWKSLSIHHNVILDEFIIMPDHIHFILVIKNDLNKNQNKLENNENLILKNNNKGESRLAPTLGWIVGIFKTESTKRINKLNETPKIQLWQRNYYERVIRNEKEYLMIKKYIRDNPKNLGL